MTTFSIIKQNQKNGNVETILDREPNKEDAVKVFNDIEDDNTDIKIKLIVNPNRGMQYTLRTK